jgi:hypothetical protein
VQVHVHGSLKLFGHLSMVHVREYAERNWWLIGLLAAFGVIGFLAKWLLPFWVALIVGVVVLLLSALISPRARARVIERVHLPMKRN